jgi:hypothetical protein
MYYSYSGCYSEWVAKVELLIFAVACRHQGNFRNTLFYRVFRQAHDSFSKNFFKL